MVITLHIQINPNETQGHFDPQFSPYDKENSGSPECCTKPGATIIFTNIYQAIIKVRYFLYVIAAILAAQNVVTLNMINLIFPNIYKAEMKAAISEEVKEKKITTLWITLNDI